MENITFATLAELNAAVEAEEVTLEEAVEELTRRIDKREAAGKHPMVHVVARRDELAEELEAA